MMQADMGAGFVPAPPRRRPLVRALCEQRRRQLEEGPPYP